MLVDQQAGKLAHSDQAVMCSTIKGLTTDWSLLSCSSRTVSLAVSCHCVKRPMYAVDSCILRDTSVLDLHMHTLTRTLAETMGPGAREIYLDKHLTRDSSKRPNKLNVCVDGQEGIRSVVLIVSECAVAVPLSS